MTTCHVLSSNVVTLDTHGHINWLIIFIYTILAKAGEEKQLIDMHVVTLVTHGHINWLIMLMNTILAKGWRSHFRKDLKSLADC